MSELKCTYCGGTKFYEGPSGGASTNILCANPKCRHWFNATPFGLEDLNRVEPTEGQKQKEKEDLEKRKRKNERKVYDEGKRIYQANKSAKVCLSDHTHGGSTATHNNIIRLCGFVDGFVDAFIGVEKNE